MAVIVYVCVCVWYDSDSTRARKCVGLVFGFELWGAWDRVRGCGGQVEGVVSSDVGKLRCVIDGYALC
jgi:hypothetical protein